MKRIAEELYRKLLARWNAQDAAGFAALFIEDAHVVGFDGSMMFGRQAIESTLAQIFAEHPTATYVAKVRQIHCIGADAAMLTAVAGMIPPDGRDLNPNVNAIQSLVAVRDGHDWRIALFQNTPAAFHGRPEESAKLTAELKALAEGR